MPAAADRLPGPGTERFSMTQPPPDVPAGVVRAEGSGSIAVGGDAINSIFVTGGVNQFFVGRYERLADAYIDVGPLYRELHIEDFTGRAWLVAAIDEFVTSNDRGYLILEAEAGLGKTAFMAWVSKQRGYVHHFVRLMADPDDVGAALRNLSAQLIRAWDLTNQAVGGILPPAASRPEFFEEILYEAANKRDATKPEEPYGSPRRAPRTSGTCGRTWSVSPTSLASRNAWNRQESPPKSS